MGKNQKNAQSDPKDQSKDVQTNEQVTSDAQDAQSAQSEETSAEQVQASTPDPGNPYTVSADGRGSVYNPAVDGAPGKEAEEKQAKNDEPQ